jgi:cytochrome b561
MDLVISEQNMTMARIMGYGVISKLLHWGMAVLVLFSLCAVEFKDLFPKGEIRHQVVGWHFQLGLCVLLLILVRIIWRMKNPAPPIFPPLSRIQALAASTAHFSLYALMLILPVIGVLTRQARGNDVEFFGHMLPAFLDEDSGLSYALKIKSVHTFLGDVLIGLVAVHVLIAFFHHLVRRDNTLSRMLP